MIILDIIIPYNVVAKHRDRQLEGALGVPNQRFSRGFSSKVNPGGSKSSLELTILMKSQPWSIQIKLAVEDSHQKSRAGSPEWSLGASNGAWEVQMKPGTSK